MQSAEGSVTTFNDFATRVLDEREEDGIRGIVRERSRYRVHVATAAFASMPIDEDAIEPRHVAEWLREMSLKQPKDTRGARKIARATINRSKALVSVVFAEAVRLGLRKTNPCVGQKLKRRPGEEATKDTWAFLTLEEQRKLATCAAVPKADRLAMQFAFWTGLRQGEQRHLQIGDIHVEDHDPHVIVRYASRSPKDGSLLPPKSGKVRRVPLLPEAQAVTREWLAMLPTFAPQNPHNLAFPTARGNYRAEGKPLGRGDLVRRHYKTAGIELRPYLHWHALRHTFCSSLISGVWGRRWTLEEVRPIAGHSSIVVTTRYAHMAEDIIAKAARETVAEPEQVAIDVPPECMPEIVERRGIFARMRDAFRALRGVA